MKAVNHLFLQIKVVELLHLQEAMSLLRHLHDHIVHLVLHPQEVVVVGLLAAVEAVAVVWAAAVEAAVADNFKVRFIKVSVY
jgi:hypothetical protein